MRIKRVWLTHVRAPSLGEVLSSSITGGTIRMRRKAAPDLLEQFCRIAEAPDTDAAVVAFAKRWGVLGLCEHGLPYGHLRTDEPMFRYEGDMNDDDQFQVSMEPLCKPAAESFQHWKELALRFDSLLRIGLQLNRDTFGSRLDWELASTDPDFSPWDESNLELIRASMFEARFEYELLIERLMELSQMKPRFWWSNGFWNIDVDSNVNTYSNLLAILTSQLMLRVSSPKAQIKCSECPRWFVPRRNQRKYCNNCGNRAAWRVSKRKQRGQKDGPISADVQG